ncbi:MAG TPA: hypothetical protein PLP23_17640 [Panacibacter sp.]|nr:hypothetical protein [Panacibacter sp.]
MYKTLTVASIIAASLLLIITIILIYFNWGEKIKTPILSLFVIWTGTSFVTIFLMLKETRQEENFASYLIIDKRTLVPANTWQMDRHGIDYSEVQKHKINPRNGDIIHPFDEPKDEKTSIEFNSKLLLYELYREIYALQYEQQGMKVDNNGFEYQLRKPFPQIELVKIPFKSYEKDVKDNPFITSEVEKYWIEQQPLLLPKGTFVSLNTKTNDKGKQEYSLLIKKNYFFSLEINVHPCIISDALPKNQVIIPEMRPYCKTYIYPITLKATFDRLTAGNINTEKYKDWVKDMFESIKSKFGDSLSD